MLGNGSRTTTQNSKLVGHESNNIIPFYGMILRWKPQDQYLTFWEMWLHIPQGIYRTWEWMSGSFCWEWVYLAISLHLYVLTSWCVVCVCWFSNEEKAGSWWTQKNLSTTFLSQFRKYPNLDLHTSISLGKCSFTHGWLIYSAFINVHSIVDNLVKDSYIDYNV